MFFYIFVVLLLFSGYNTNNPLVSALCVVISLVVVCPLIVVSVHQWFIYTIVMLFLSGILVIVVYFASLSSYSYKAVIGVNIFLVFSIIFYPHLLVYFSNVNISILFNPINLILLIFILSNLLVLINFTSYILSRGSAIRSF